MNTERERLHAKLSAAEKERDSLKSKLAVAVERLEKLRDGPGNKMVAWKMTWASEFATEALKAINGGES